MVGLTRPDGREVVCRGNYHMEKVLAQSWPQLEAQGKETVV